MSDPWDLVVVMCVLSLISGGVGMVAGCSMAVGRAMEDANQRVAEHTQSLVNALDLLNELTGGS